MTRPFHPDQIEVGMYLIIVGYKPIRLPLPTNDEGDLLSINAQAFATPMREPSGLPFKVLYWSFPFIIGYTLGQSALETLDISRVELRIPEDNYVAAFETHIEMFRTAAESKQPLYTPHVIETLKKRIKPMAKQSGKTTSSQASDIGSKGGKKGGPSRAAKLTAQQRADIARKGAAAKNSKGKK